MEAAVSLLEFGDLSGSPLLHRIVARPVLLMRVFWRFCRHWPGLVMSKPGKTDGTAGRFGRKSAGTETLVCAGADWGSRRAHPARGTGPKAGPSQLLAARLLAGLGDSRGYALLLDTARGGQKRKPSARLLSMDLRTLHRWTQLPC